MCERCSQPLVELGPKRPNDPRVRGAGPARKALSSAESMQAPHPLQPIVRPPTALERQWLKPDEPLHLLTTCSSSRWCKPC
jgi:hypothetical protein